LRAIWVFYATQNISWFKISVNAENLGHPTDGGVAIGTTGYVEPLPMVESPHAVPTLQFNAVRPSVSCFVEKLRSRAIPVLIFTIVHMVNLSDIFFCKVCVPFNRKSSFLVHNRGTFGSVLCECVSSVHHNRVYIERRTERINFVLLVFSKPTLFVFFDVIEHDCDVIISIRSRLFVKKTQSMHHFVHDNVGTSTVFS